MNVLVTGGAGYIGSVTVELLRRHRSRPVVLDDLVNGHRSSVDVDVPFYLGRTGDSDLVKRIVDEHDIAACIHFAAYAYVGESVEAPAKYFENNTLQSIALLNTLRECGVNKFVFSSTCAVYGTPDRIPIDESHPQRPVNPYGWSKFMVERVLESYSAAYGLRYVALRYFNAAGATELHGEHHDPETHLIPNVLRAAAGEIPHVSIFGNDYPTPDGTCIRDYIHVSDLADAHIRSLEYLKNGGPSTSLNLGNGVGFSVLEIVNAAKGVTGGPIEYLIEERRAGDPPQLVADAAKAFDTIGWKPQFSDINEIISSAWEWKLRNPAGYIEE